MADPHDPKDPQDPQDPQVPGDPAPVTDPDSPFSGGRRWEPLGDGPVTDPGRHVPLDLSGAEHGLLLIGTKKNAFFAVPDGPARAQWRLEGPVFLGYIVHHAVLDPRDNRSLLLAVRTGHLGPTVFRSHDAGATWREASQPPAFSGPDVRGVPRAVQQVFWLSPGHAEQPGTWYAGCSPEGLFRSDDGGDTWAPEDGWNDHPRWPEWTSASDDMQATPDGSPLHSILVDPRDPTHLYLATSSGGLFESADSGGSWTPRNENVACDFLPDPYPEVGQDVHCAVLHPLAPNRLYQQNHCGIYRLDRPATRWQRIGENMPSAVGDVGFAITLHARDPDTAWVFPMDGTDVWPRTSVAGQAAAYRTRDGGQSWQRQANGLPEAHGWYTVYRQAMASDADDPVGVYFGTTNGEVWASNTEGEHWAPIALHLPQVLSVEHGVLAANAPARGHG